MLPHTPSHHMAAAAALFMCAVGSAAAGSLPDVAFWDNDWPSDTTGALEGTVLFAQHQVLPSKHTVDGDDQPHLTAWRKALVMFKPKAAAAVDPAQEMRMFVVDKEGRRIGDVAMAPPDDIPKDAGWREPVVGEVAFPSPLENAVEPKNIADVNNETGAHLADLLTNKGTNVTVKTYNGRWTKYTYLPPADSVPAGSMVHVSHRAGYSMAVRYRNTVTGLWRSKTMTNGMDATFVLHGGRWVGEEDMIPNEYVFGHGFFTAVTQAVWVQPGMRIEFSQGGRLGVLEEAVVGGASELLIHTIDAGFLVEPRGAFAFAKDVAAHREYYEKLPVSRLVVTQYESLHLTEVMLPDGTLYTTSSAVEGGWHTGDMRQHTGKVLISHGIDMANYGKFDSAASSERDHPFTCAQLAAHNTVGIYTNGRQVHGGSGGNGIITLDSSLGNEFSHEAGHNYGLGHYVGGFDGSVHRAAVGEGVGATWGWDSGKNVFVPNFRPAVSNKETCCCPGAADRETCEPPFQGRSFGKDSMAGGAPMWPEVNRFTLYTPHVSRIIQGFLEGKAVFDNSSATGYRKYNPGTGAMDEFANPSNAAAPVGLGVPVTTLVGYYDPVAAAPVQDYIYPALHGAYGYVYPHQNGSTGAGGCELRVETAAGQRAFALAAARHRAAERNKYHVNVAAADGAFRAAVYCNGTERVARDLAAPEGDVKFTVNGRPFWSPPETPAPDTTLVEATLSPQPEGAAGFQGTAYCIWFAVLMALL
eukprot:TRINITY_DN5939_c0_g1_i2.p1 TRINITY_DN5939_c0_g1~~TRINITY_DN5939_c0_g1_i2.p1  ORF type:complete len:754 (+),score=254.52 TRINITY_DN5939_c0_g1_i2:36-2297(+)